VLRSLHDHGIPVRRGGAPRKRDHDRALRRLTALYHDPDVAALLRRHRIPERPMPGTITERFPTPTPVTRSFLAEAYTEIGLAAEHIEQLTGQPAERVLQLLHELLRHRHLAPEAKCSAGHLETRDRLGALVLIQIDAALHPPNGLFVVPMTDDLGDAQLFFDV